MKTVYILGLILALSGEKIDAQEQGFLDLEGVHRTASLLLVLKNADHSEIGYGTGVLLFNYVEEGRPLLLTAKHVFDAANYVEPMTITREGSHQPLVRRDLPLRDEKGAPIFWTYGNVDMALLPISQREFNKTSIKGLARSKVSYSSGVLNGEQVLLFGAAMNPVFEKYEGARQFLVTSGTIALQTDSTYVVDQTAFRGMSGGAVFRQAIIFRPEGDKLYPVFGYTAIGLVTRNVAELGDKYTQVIKMDYVDSILQRYEHVGWGTSPTRVETKKH